MIGVSKSADTDIQILLLHFYHPSYHREKYRNVQFVSTYFNDAINIATKLVHNKSLERNLLKMSIIAVFFKFSDWTKGANSIAI